MTETAEVGLFTKIRGLFRFSGNGSKHPEELPEAKPAEPPIEAKPKTRWPAGSAHVPPFTQGSGMPGIKSWSPGPGMIPTGQAKELRNQIPKTDPWPAGRVHARPFISDSGMPGAESWSPGSGKISIEQAKGIRQELKRVDKYPSPPPIEPSNPEAAASLKPQPSQPTSAKVEHKPPFRYEDMNPLRRHVPEPLGHLSKEERQKRTQ